MNKAAIVSAAVALVLPALSWAGGPQTVLNPPVAASAEDLKRAAALAEFTAKMKAANYPALFEQAAQEFNVPADVLKGIAFAETRWDNLTWAPGDLASPDSGMPRPYGIMSLWDNPFFGHSLLEAAALLGETPEQLKQDPLQNMRGAAALLRKLYDENPKPEGTTEAEVESWRYAIRTYCGIPEPELNAQHALDIYVWMSKGYHEYGIDWNARPVNLEPIRLETARIVADAEARHQARLAAGSNTTSAIAVSQLGPGTMTDAEERTRRLSDPPAAIAVVARIPGNTQAAAPSEPTGWRDIALAMVILSAIALSTRGPAKPVE